MVADEDGTAVALPGRSAARIEADLAVLHEEITRARERAAGMEEGSVQYQRAIESLAMASRKLVEYEARIPQYRQAYRLSAGVLLARRAGLALGVFALALGLAAWPHWINYGWLAPLVGMLLSGGWVRMDAQGNAQAAMQGSGAVFKPEGGAVFFAGAALAALLGSAGVLTDWVAVPLALVGTWGGMCLFGVAEVTPSGWGQ